MSLPRLVISFAQADSLLRTQIARGEAILTSEVTVTSQLADWEAKTKELLSSMFSSAKIAEEFSQPASEHLESRARLAAQLQILTRVRDELEHETTLSPEFEFEARQTRISAARIPEQPSYPTASTPQPSPPPKSPLLAPIIGLVALLSGLVGSGMYLVPRISEYLNPPPTPTPTSTPLPTPTPITNGPDLEARIANEIKKLVEGRLAFNPPDTMKQGQPERIEARITSEQNGSQLTAGLSGRGTPQIEKIKVGNVMKVFLSAEQDDFRIAKLSSDEQLVTGRSYAQWEWTVTPLDYGEHTLHLKAVARVFIEGVGEKSVDVPVIDKTIKVRISPTYIVKTKLSNASAWQLLLGGGGLLSLASTLFVGVRRYRNKRKRIQAGFAPNKK